MGTGEGSTAGAPDRATEGDSSREGFADAHRAAGPRHDGASTASRRPTQRELAAAKKLARQQDMARAIAEGRLTVRTMTAEERARSEARSPRAKGRKPPRSR